MHNLLLVGAAWQILLWPLLSIRAASFADDRMAAKGASAGLQPPTLSDMGSYVTPRYVTLYALTAKVLHQKNVLALNVTLQTLTREGVCHPDSKINMQAYNPKQLGTLHRL